MADQTVIVFDRDGDPATGLQTWDPVEPEIIASGSPLQRGHVYFCGAAERLTACCAAADDWFRGQGEQLRERWKALESD